MDQIKTVLFVFALGLAATAQDTAPAQTQRPCPSGYHHEAGSAACWPDVSRQESHAAVQPPSALPSTQPPTVPAQPVPSQPAQTQPVQSASLVIFREGHFTGSALKPSIFVDDREVARLKNGSFFSMQIEPGKHNLTSSAKHESPLVVEIKPGETSYVQMIVVTGTWRGAGRLVPVPADDGKIAVSKLKLLELK